MGLIIEDYKLKVVLICLVLGFSLGKEGSKEASAGLAQGGAGQARNNSRTPAWSHPGERVLKVIVQQATD